jgi:hypothetical protein
LVTTIGGPDEFVLLKFFELFTSHIVCSYFVGDV